MKLIEQVKQDLEKRFGYDFENEFFTDEIKTLVDEVIESTKCVLCKT